MTDTTVTPAPQRRRRLTRRVALVGTVAAAVGTTALLMPTGAFASSASSADAGVKVPGKHACGTLPAYVEGQPADLKPGVDASYLWHDGTGWHLRVTHAGTAEAKIVATVVSARPMTSTKVVDEAQDKLREGKKHKRLRLTAVNHGALDGVDFTTDCAGAIGVRISVDGHKLAPADIHLGAGGQQPQHNPFAVRRQEAKTPAPATGS